jgi:creatinine amidohydrolase
VWAPRRWTQVTDDTGTGNPAAATVEKGEKFLEAVTTKIATFLVDLAKADTGNMYE